MATDIELLPSFIVETLEMLDEVEPILIELQQNSTDGIDEDTIGVIFRLFHSMKGGAGFMELDVVVAVTHEAETLLDLFRQGAASISDAHITILCDVLDCIRDLIDKVEENGTDAGEEKTVAPMIAAIIKEINIINGEEVAEEKPKEEGTKTYEPAKDETTAVPTAPESDNEKYPTVKIDITDEMRKSFVQEGDEMIELIEQSLLAIAGQEASTVMEEMNETFRAMHSLKGNCGFMGFSDMETICHIFETALDIMKNGGIDTDFDQVGILLNSLDIIKQGMVDISSGGNGTIKDVETHRNAILNLLPEKTSKIIKESFTEKVEAVFSDPPKTPSKKEETPVVPVVKEAAIEEKTTKPKKENKPITQKQEPLKTKKVAAVKRQDIRVDLEKLDQLINLVGELTIAESMVTTHKALDGIEDETFDKSVHLLRRISRDLQDISMSVRMIPLSGTFRKMIRLVHDLSKKLDKPIDLKLIGEGTEVDKTVFEQIGDPLVHIVRNAADHGIENKEERAKTDKDERSTITIEGRHEGGEVWILITEDGKGLNREVIGNKAIKNELITKEEFDEMPDEDVYKLIFEAGFSTAASTTDVSGRGVGMDVVKKNIEKLKGKIDIKSTPGKGTTFILRIPLTLAIIEGMLVSVGDTKYTTPLLAIKESFKPIQSQITMTPDGQESVRIRDQFFPILRLHEIFNKEDAITKLEDGIIMLIESDGQTIALFVDEIIGQQETVIKGLSGFLGSSHGVSGCTILGDGSVSLILDVNGIVELCNKQLEKNIAN